MTSGPGSDVRVVSQPPDELNSLPATGTELEVVGVTSVVRRVGGGGQNRHSRPPLPLTPRERLPSTRFLSYGYEKERAYVVLTAV